MRTYEETHPWITFKVDMRRAAPDIWMLLGEAKSKCNHIAGVHLRPIEREELHKVYLAKGVQATTSIEGNTLSEEQVIQKIEGRLDLSPSKKYLEQEVENIIRACNEIGSSILVKGSQPIKADKILRYNSLVLDKLNLPEDVIPGEFRKHSVGVGTYWGAPAEDCEYLVNELCKWFNGTQFQPTDEYKIVYGILKAILAHLYIAWIHPFGDGNGRTARLLEFRFLLESGVPTPAAHLLSNHYNETRSEYYRQLELSSKSDSNVMHFIKYAVQGFVDGLKDQLKIIIDQQHDIIWQNFVHESFTNLTKKTDIRRKDLVLELSEKSKPIPVRELRHISGKVAEYYANKTRKTLNRDIEKLIDMNLVKRMAQGVTANKDILRYFLPQKLEIA